MKQLASLLLLNLVLFSMTACVQMPTEKQGVSDLRPQISFVAEPAHYDAMVFVDNIQMGRVGDYIDGKAALRILPGSHVLRVVAGGTVLLDEKFYVGDGVSRSFMLR